jgi:hypothetical protein
MRWGAVGAVVAIIILYIGKEVYIVFHPGLVQYSAVSILILRCVFPAIVFGFIVGTALSRHLRQSNSH